MLARLAGSPPPGRTVSARRAVALLAVPVALVVGLGACGSSDGSSSGSGDGATTASSSREANQAPVSLSGDVTNKGTKTVAATATTLEVELDDFYFEPTFVKAAPGQKLTIELENEGSQTHTFTSAPLGVDEELEPGQDATIEVTVPTDGAAGFFCRFHRSQGMQGALFTVDGQSVTS